MTFPLNSVARVRRGQNVLSAAFVRQVSLPGKYFDGHGLILRVGAGGAKYWFQRLTIRGRRHEIGIGNPSLVSLAEARELALVNRKLARSGGDPLSDKRRSKAMLSFEEAAGKVHKELSPTWKNPKDRAAFLSTLQTHAFPRFGSVAVSEVTSADVRQLILGVRKKTPEAARKLAIRVASVFRWAIAEGLRPDNPATAEALALPKVEKIVSHRKALKYTEVAACLAAVKSSRASIFTKLAIEFLVLTASRSGETRGARWDEFSFYSSSDDGETVGTWEIPAARMKMKRIHRVPLCSRAARIVRHCQELQPSSDFVFPGNKNGKPLSDMTLSKLIKELGFEVDIHGFRTSFRTWAQDLTDFPREVAEAALAHSVKDAAERAYARSDLFEKRRSMMDEWAKYIEI